jgi:hypothetical protein
MKLDAHSTWPITFVSKLTWKYTWAILPHRCIITKNILWCSKHYKVKINYDSISLINGICYKWVNSSDGTQLILSDNLEAALFQQF